MPEQTPPPSEFLLYRTDDGCTRVECRFADETIWLTQAMMAELFQTSVPNINSHLKSIYEVREVEEGATVKSYLIVRAEGQRRGVSRGQATANHTTANHGYVPVDPPVDPESMGSNPVCGTSRSRPTVTRSAATLDVRYR